MAIGPALTRGRLFAIRGNSGAWCYIVLFKACALCADMHLVCCPLVSFTLNPSLQ